MVEQDALDDATELAAERYDLIVVADLAPRLSPSELQQAINKLAPALTRGGKLLFNMFLLEAGALPTSAERERAQRSFSTYLADADVSRLMELSTLKLRSSVQAAASGAAARKQSGSALVATTAMSSAPLQLEQPTNGYLRWSAGERTSQPGTRALPVRLDWLCLMKE